MRHDGRGQPPHLQHHEVDKSMSNVKDATCKYYDSIEEQAQAHFSYAKGRATID